MKILIDADGCPVTKLTCDIAKKNGIECIVISDTSHIFNINGIKTITVSKGNDSVDFYLVNLISSKDIVVTQDYGVAALSLGKGAYAIGNSGLWYTKDNIDRLLFERFMHGKVRRAGKMGRGGGPKKRTDADDENFRQSFKKLINNIMSK